MYLQGVLLEYVFYRVLNCTIIKNAIFAKKRKHLRINEEEREVTLYVHL